MKTKTCLFLRPFVLAGLALASPVLRADSDPAVIRSAKLTGTTLTIQTDDLPRRLASDKKVFVEFNGVVVAATFSATTEIVTASLASAPPAGTYLLSILKENRATRAGEDSVSDAFVAVGAVGAPGPQGLQGLKGDKGDTGATGATGPQGVAGTSGATGAVGAVGAQGLKGDIGATGATGAAGAKGDKGDTGVAGMAGATGPQGVKGDTGATGPQGAVGPQGVKGDAGAIGATGALGPQGAQGAKGDKGDTGVAGVAGATGPQGLKGETGATGAQGAVGPQGVKGDAGAIGATGALGPQGVQGAKGDKGDTGVAGVAGATGPQGLKGDTGATGPQGATGAVGAIGAQGVTGLTGLTGPQGLQGVSGNDGTPGAPGARGADGVAGGSAVVAIESPGQNLIYGGAKLSDTLGNVVFVSHGAPGAMGAIGATGPQGATGAIGAVGAPGSTGPQGSSGPQGLTGNPGIQGLKGDTGATGATGPQGLIGLTGGNGVDGKTVLNGAVSPSNSLGTNGDFYFRTDNNKFFGPKTAGDWGVGVSLVGPTGATGDTGVKGAAGVDGKTILNGTTAPGGSVGTIGDFYLNTDVSKLFGPKTSGGWGTGVSLIGADGAVGATGAKGATGTAGADGVSPFTLKSDDNIYYTAGNVGLGTTVPQARLHVKASVTAGDGPENHVAYIENTKDGNNTNGLAIRLNNSVKTSGTVYGLNDSNNFITFYRNTSLPNLVINPPASEIAGRIEAVSVLNFQAMLTEIRSLISTNGALPANLMSMFSLNYTIQTNPLASGFPISFGSPLFGIDSGAVTNVATTLRTNFDNAVWAYQLWTDPVAAAIAESVITLDRGGVTYESGSGDYAEWLERSDPAETIRFGDIVGVRGGRISRITAGADQLLVVSHKPIVLGNSPAPGREALSEKVAFMGQVPVKIIGQVRRGDFVLASGAGDGFGRAVAPGAMTAELSEQVVGVAWGESAIEILKFVNVAVGLRPMHAIGVAKAQQEQIRNLESKLASVETELVRVRKLGERLTGMMAALETRASEPAVTLGQEAAKVFAATAHEE